MRGRKLKILIAALVCLLAAGIAAAVLLLGGEAEEKVYLKGCGKTDTVFGSAFTKKTDITSIVFESGFPGYITSWWDVSEKGDGSVKAWVDKTGSLHICSVPGWVIVFPEDSSYMFWEYTNVTRIEFDGNINTSRTVNMSFMFADCKYLTSLDVSGFDTANVTDMSLMFDDCTDLKSLDVSGFDTAKVTDMSWMFYNCQSLEFLDVSGFDTRWVRDMSWMFYNCASLRELDISGFSTVRVKDDYGMTYGCENVIK